jgi:3-oxoacyl-[acyl-carrier protein] reductase
MLLADKVAIITGGARGMGGGIALRFAEEGCSAVIADVLDAEAKRTVEDIRKKGRDAIFVRCDVSDRHQVKDMVSRAISKFKKVDILVNSAGIGTPPRTLEDTSEEEWDRVVDINMKGTFLCCQAIAPHMKENNSGNIINIVSLAALGGGAMSIHYAASKAGALSVSRCVASALAPYNIRVNAILPGMIRTDMSAVFAGPEVKDVDAFYAKMAKGVALGRIGTTDDIASAALFLASEQSSYITGDSISLGGGGMRMGGGPGPR